LPSAAMGRKAPSDRASGKGERLAILCGGGKVPLEVAAAAAEAGRDFVVLAVRGQAGSEIERFPHEWLHVGEVGRLFKLLAKHDCAELVITGHVRRPEVKTIRFDLGGMMNLPRILAMMMGGDNHLLTNMIAFIEERGGVRVVGPEEIAPKLVLGQATVGRRKPSRQNLHDIALARRVLAALAPFDVGQCVVVDRGRVVAVEAAEGTDAMLKRCAELRAGHVRRPSGVLVKAPKQGQEMRIDLPAIGARTVEGAAEARLAGIAAQAGATLVADGAEMAAAARRLGLFVTGFAG
jgi:UDP-2,3-diacylglucosamine hydrolase